MHDTRLAHIVLIDSLCIIYCERPIGLPRFYKITTVTIVVADFPLARFTNLYFQLADPSPHSFNL